jgi:hypothetical protein
MDGYTNSSPRQTIMQLIVLLVLISTATALGFVISSFVTQDPISDGFSQRSTSTTEDYEELVYTSITNPEKLLAAFPTNYETIINQVSTEHYVKTSNLDRQATVRGDIATDNGVTTFSLMYLPSKDIMDVKVTKGSTVSNYQIVVTRRAK